ncbi:hypothetical protein [Haloarcula salina]|uniref:hypothetical protein n=1 Tax=Haloarcula salina TaxID=1429914 RepID=UPI001392093E|nr:hypothetical protein [Haloarcula salina]
MSFCVAAVPSLVSETSPSRFVCPLCERTFDRPRSACTHCGSTVVVPLDDGTVYDSVLSMCGR